MKSLYESIFDNKEKLASDINRKLKIDEFLKQNYSVIGWEEIGIDKFKVIKDGEDIVLNVSDLNLQNEHDILLNKGASSITDGLFRWGNMGNWNFRIPDGDNLKSLEGCPEKVWGFELRSKNITSLKGAPQENVYYTTIACDKIKNLKGLPAGAKIVYIAGKNLKSLEGFPNYTNIKEIHITSDILKNLKGCPKKCGEFNCVNCTNLESLEGAPEVVTNFDCSHTGITDLKGAPKICTKFTCKGCKQLVSTKGCSNYKRYNFMNCSSLTDIDNLPIGSATISLSRTPMQGKI